MKLCLTNLTIVVKHILTIVVKHKLTTFVKHKLTMFVKNLTIIVKHWLTIFRQHNFYSALTLRVFFIFSTLFGFAPSGQGKVDFGSSSSKEMLFDAAVGT